MTAVVLPSSRYAVRTRSPELTLEVIAATTAVKMHSQDSDPHMRTNGSKTTSKIALQVKECQNQTAQPIQVPSILRLAKMFAGMKMKEKEEKKMNLVQLIS